VSPSLLKNPLLVNGSFAKRQQGDMGYFFQKLCLSSGRGLGGCSPGAIPKESFTGDPGVAEWQPIGEGHAFLVMEESNAGERHHHPVLLGGRNNILVTH